MTTIISSKGKDGSVSYSWSGAVGESVKHKKLRIQGQLTHVSFSRRMFRGSIEYLDGNGVLRTEWFDMTDIVALE